MHAGSNAFAHNPRWTDLHHRFSLDQPPLLQEKGHAAPFSPPQPPVLRSLVIVSHAVRDVFKSALHPRRSSQRKVTSKSSSLHGEFILSGEAVSKTSGRVFKKQKQKIVLDKSGVISGVKQPDCPGGKRVELSGQVEWAHTEGLVFWQELLQEACIVQYFGTIQLTAAGSLIVEGEFIGLNVSLIYSLPLAQLGILLFKQEHGTFVYHLNQAH
ncbi:hypothetical protein BJ741DRAFT_256745 [Chytriomyces cf. hyalinus JEL632]|nr:hypothetical protein BJ741DRAFT_256745 [Chytriomyces cf. hyalinus JEL632]